MKELIEPQDHKAYLISVIAASLLVLALIVGIAIGAWVLYRVNQKETNFKTIKVKHI